MKTLLLDRSTWDFVIDAAANWAVAFEPYSIAQDICTALRTFYGEVWYDATRGVRYFDLILGKQLNSELIRQIFADVALTVPLVLSARCVITGLENRRLSGYVEFTYDVSGVEGQNGARTGTIFFIGDNAALVTFVGDNGGALGWEGQIIG